MIKTAEEVKSLEEMRAFAENFLKNLKSNENGATVLCLSGDLGSGKTTFTQQVINIFGVKEYATSPTFILQKKYEVQKPPESLKQIAQIIHMDMYRIEDPDELKVLGFTELLHDSKNLLIIEWPEKIKDQIPSGSAWLKFEFVDETTRRVQWS